MKFNIAAFKQLFSKNNSEILHFEKILAMNKDNEYSDINYEVILKM